MNFGLNDEQREIQSTAREFLASRFKPEKVRELAESRTYDDGIWKEISELGWPGIAVAEEDGGQGLGLIELVLIAEQPGYALAPTPLMSTWNAALCPRARAPMSSAQRWLPGVASGEALGAAAFDGRTEGAVVPDAEAAEVLVLSTGEDAARIVDPADADHRAARPHRHDPPLLQGLGRRRRGDPRRRRRRGRPRARRARGRAHRRRRARDGDGRRLREGARAVRPPDRRLPGRLAPLRADALRRRGGALAHLLRGVDRRRRARVAAARLEHGEGPRLGRRARRSPRPRSRSSAASASPGSTTSTSC